MLLPRLNHRLIFASAIFLLLVCGSALAWMLYRIYNGEEWVRHSYKVELLVADIGANLSRSGRVRQTYLDTGGKRYLDDIEATRSDIFDKISQLKLMVQDNIDEERAAENLEEATRARFLTFDESLQLFQSGRSTPEAQDRYTQELVRWSQQTSSIMQTMQDTESNLLSMRLLLTKSLFSWIVGVLAVSYLLSIYMLWEHYRGLTGELNQRKQAEENARSLSSQLLNAQDQERRKIARDLHDGLGQNLAAAKMITDSMLNRPPDKQKILELSAILHDGLASTRSISHLLHPPLVDELGFVTAARSYLEGFSSRTGLQLDADLLDSDVRLPRDLELTLFRVLQEALSNVQRHSKSSKAEVHFRADQRNAILRIRDFGVGLPPDTIRSFQENGTSVGVGLAGMKERVRERNGRFEIHSDSNGTSILATFPLSFNGSSA